MVKVSVVIPVYNVEKYLADCLDSIVNQTLDDIEIICINDGSTDDSLKILNEYAERDDRISVYSQENGGHAVATNRGMDLATGDYLFLMDSDDIVDVKALELSYDAAIEKDVDFVLFKVINYDDENDRYYESEFYSMNKLAKKVGDNIFNYKDAGKLMFKTCVTPWSKLYRRDFIMDNNIRFPEGLIFEDNVFFFNAMLNAEKIYFLKEFLFTRRWYATSSTTNGDLRFLDTLAVYNLIIDLFKKHDEFDNYKENLYNNKIDLAFMRYNNIREEFKKDFFDAMKKDFIKLLDEDTYETFVNSISYRNHKIFEHVIISENSIEFDRLRKIYGKKMGCYNNYLNKHDKIYFEYIKSSIDRYNRLKGSKRHEYFNIMRNEFINLLNHELFSEIIIKKVSYHYKKYFEQVIISNNSVEFDHLRKLYDLSMGMGKLRKKEQSTKKEYNKVKDFNESLLNSNSWKLTERFRENSD